jgi:ATP-dependent Clp protease adaptor protein ClpS
MPLGQPLVEERVGTDPAERLARPWVVVVWDDPINLMSYVTLVLQRVFAFPRERAEQLMLQVHHEGRAVVAAEPREQAELHVAQLHAYGLQATMEPDA